MKRYFETIWAILFLACALITGCGGGGGGGIQQPVDQADESALITSTLKSFLASIQDSDSQTARGFYSENLQSNPAGIDLTVSDLGGPTFDPALKQTFIFTILPGDIVYLSPDLCIVKAICENLDGYRVVITFTMSKIAQIWFIDNIDIQNTAIPAAPAPTISTLTPDSGINLSPLSISIAGTGFKTGATIHMTRSGQNTVSATEVTINNSGTEITCVLPLNGLQAGTWSVVVINPDGQSVTSASLFTVSEPDPPPPDLPAPTISQLTPNSGNNNSSLAATIYGTGFQNLATVKLINGATTVNVDDIAVAQDGTSIACTLPLNGLQAGLWNVVVTNPDTRSVIGSNLLTVISSNQPPPDLPAPTISQLTPNSGNNDSSLTTTIYGTGFQNLATVKLISGETTINIDDIAVAQNGTSIACTFPLNGLEPGLWNVVVTNPDTKSVIGSNLLTVLPPPSLSNISPASGQVGCVVTLNGNYLGTSGLIKVGDVNASSITWSSQTITFAIPSGVTSGQQTVTVTPAGTQSTTQQTFTVPVWQIQTVADVTAVLKDVDFNGTTGWIVGEETILKSTDSGKTWQTVSGVINANGVDLRGVRAIADNALMVGYFSSMAGNPSPNGYFLTYKMGQWDENAHEGSSELFTVAGTSIENNVVIGGVHALAISSQAVGQIAYFQSPDWNDIVPNIADPLPQMPTALPFNIKHISTPDGQIYYAVGDVPVPNSSIWGLAKSDNKGETWVMHSQDNQSLPPEVNYCGVHFLDTSKGWAVGENGTIIKTTDGGTTWSPQVIDGSLSAVNLRSVYFTDAQNGIVVGDAGTILTTTDGGSTWTLLSQPPAIQNLKRVKFTDASNGWIVGGNGVILRTTTGGR